MVSEQFNMLLATRYAHPASRRMIKEAFDKSRLLPATLSAIKRTLPTECCVVFSDISGFSSTVNGMDARQVKAFLDPYYATILPIILKHGGLVDQMMGDGIISVYSKELSADRIDGTAFDSGLKAAEEIVAFFSTTTKYETKCALNKDSAVLCMLGDDTYQQATLVGNILTGLYRVESVAVPMAVNMLYSIPEASAMYASVAASKPTSPPQWRLSLFEAELAGLTPQKQTILCEMYQPKVSPS